MILTSESHVVNSKWRNHTGAQQAPPPPPENLIDYVFLKSHFVSEFYK